MTTYLLDTHPLLWALSEDPSIPASMAAEIDAEPSRFLVSDVSLWEIAIKCSTGKLQVPEFFAEVVADLGFGAVRIDRRQAWGVRNLPLHHRDPFDRLLITQASDLGVPVVTRDAAFDAYDITVVWPTD